MLKYLFETFESKFKNPNHQILGKNEKSCILAAKTKINQANDQVKSSKNLEPTHFSGITHLNPKKSIESYSKRDYLGNNQSYKSIIYF